MINSERLGKFRIPVKDFETNQDKLLTIFGRMVIVKVYKTIDYTEYVAYSEYFDMMPGYVEEIPLYKFDFIRNNVMVSGIKTFGDDTVNMPCPFCGSVDVEFAKNALNQATAIYCKNCPAGLEDNTKTVDELRVIWDTRK